MLGVMEGRKETKLTNALQDFCCFCLAPVLDVADRVSMAHESFGGGSAIGISL